MSRTSPFRPARGRHRAPVTALYARGTVAGTVVGGVVAAGLATGLAGLTTGSSAAPAARLAAVTSSAAGAVGTYAVDPDDRPRDLAGRTTAATAGTPLALAVAGQPVLTADALDAVVLRAYRQAAATVATTDPGCHLGWPDLAGIGRVESDNGRDVPAGGGITADGTLRPPILGPALDGTAGNAAIRDGAGWARAEGPMQFIPDTWAEWGADGNGDGRADVDNVFDAALGAGHYLCSGGRDLAVPAQLATAVYSYDHSDAYVTTVLTLIAAYARTDPAALLAAAGIPTASPTPTAAPTTGTPARTSAPVGPVRTAPASPPRTSSPTQAPTPTGAPTSTSETPTDGPGTDPTPTESPTP